MISWGAPPTKTPVVKENNAKAILLCPRVAERLVDTSKKTILHMEDIIKTKKTLKQAYEDIYFFMIDDKKDPSLTKEMSSIEVTIKGVKAKHSRAKENYNAEALEMGKYIPKARNCWGEFNAKQKKQFELISNFVSKDKTLTDFKTCQTKYDKAIEVARKQYDLAILYRNKNINEAKLVQEGKKLQTQAKNIMDPNDSKCSSMWEEVFYESKILEMFNL